MVVLRPAYANHHAGQDQNLLGMQRRVIDAAYCMIRLSGVFVDRQVQCKDSKSTCQRNSRPT